MRKAKGPSGLFRSSRLPPKKKANLARNVIDMAMAAATEPIRMSRLVTWDSSWERTPRSSRSSRIWRIPLVTETAACCGFRPVAKAFGWAMSLTKMRGIGMAFAWVSSRTMRYSSGYSASVTGLDLVVAMAILSEYQYIAKLKTRAMARATTAPFDPPIRPPIRTKSPPRAAIRIQVLTLFTCVPPQEDSHCHCTKRSPIQEGQEMGLDDFPRPPQVVLTSLG